MNNSTVTLQIKDIKNLYDLIKASGSSDIDEIVVHAHSKEHLPTEDGETFEPGSVLFSWNRIEFLIVEKNEE